MLIIISYHMLLNTCEVIHGKVAGAQELGPSSPAFPGAFARSLVESRVLQHDMQCGRQEACVLPSIQMGARNQWVATLGRGEHSPALSVLHPGTRTTCSLGHHRAGRAGILVPLKPVRVSPLQPHSLGGAMVGAGPPAYRPGPQVQGEPWAKQP